MTYKIEKGIPITHKPNVGGGKKKYPFEDMEIGDSFLVPCKKEKAQSVSSTLMGATKREHPKKFTTHYNLEEGGVRIWRIN